MISWTRHIILVVCVMFLISGNSEAQSTAREVLRIGRGEIQSAEWNASGDTILVSTVNGAWLYTADLQDLAHIPDAHLTTFSPDGRYIAGINNTNKLSLWDGTTFEPIKAFDLMLGTVQSWAFAWSPDSRYLAVSGGALDYGSGVILEISTSTTKPLPYYPRFDQLIWSPDGQYLVGLNRNTAIVRVWNRIGEKIFESDPHITPANSRGGWDILWRNNRQLLRVWSEHDYSLDVTGTLWDVVSGELLQDDAHVGPLGRVDYDPGGQYLAMGAYGDAAIDDAETDELIHLIDVPDTSVVLSVVWSPDGSKLALGTLGYPLDSKGTVWVIDPQTGDVTHRFDEHPIGSKIVAWNLDGNRLLSVGERNDVIIQDTITGEILARSTAHALINGTVAWKGDSSIIATADNLENVYLWNAQTGEQIVAFGGHRQPVTEIEWQPNGDLLATRGGLWNESLDTMVRVWDTEALDTSMPIQTYKIENNIIGMDWHPEGELLAVAWSEKIHIFDVTEPQRSFEAQSGYLAGDLEWSRDGKLIAMTTNAVTHTGNILIYDFANKELRPDDGWNGDPVWTWTPNNEFLWVNPSGYRSGHGLGLNMGIGTRSNYLRNLAGMTNRIEKTFLSPAGHTAIAIDEDGSGLAWNVDSGDILFMVSSVSDLTWSPDETQIAVERTDGAIWIMDAQGVVRSRIPTPVNGVDIRWQTMVWAPDNQRLAQILEGTIIIWDVDDDS